MSKKINNIVRSITQTDKNTFVFVMDADAQKVIFKFIEQTGPFSYHVERSTDKKVEIVCCYEKPLYKISGITHSFHLQIIGLTLISLLDD